MNKHTIYIIICAGIIFAMLASRVQRCSCLARRLPCRPPPLDSRPAHGDASPANGVADPTHHNSFSS